MTLLQYLKQASNTELRSIGKLPIRELESESPGHWVCFVDQKLASYDVQLVLQGKKIHTISCDCQSESDLCVHKFRMVMELNEVLEGSQSQEKKPVLKNVKTAKLTISEQLLNQTDPALVYQWLQQHFKKDKELEKNFVLTFQSEKQVEYTPQQVEQIIEQAYNVVIGKKKKADAALIKNLVEMLELSLKPVDKYLMMSVNQSISLQIVARIVLQISHFRYKVDYSSKRLSNFIDQFLNTFLGYVYNLKDSSTVERILNDMVKYIESNRVNSQYEPVYLKMFFTFITLSKMEYKSVVVPLIIRLLQGKENTDFNDITLHQYALTTFVEYDLFKEYYHLFTPIRYENTYNIFLLENLLPIDVDLTEQYANQIISLNVRAQYNLPYFGILADIYMDRGDLKQLARLQIQTFDSNCDIEDYLYIKEQLESTPEFKNFRTRLLTRLRTSSFVEISTSLLYFQILQSEGNYAKMLQVLDNTVPHEVILEIASDLMVFNSELFLKKILKLGQHHNYRININGDLAKFIVDNYPKEEVVKGLEKFPAGYASLNQVIEYMLERDGDY
ncbi:hypothetical protein [Myroides sp. LJL119]